MEEEHHSALDCGVCREKKATGEVVVPEEKKGPQGVTLSQDEYDALLAKASYGDTAAQVVDSRAIETRRIEEALEGDGD